MQCAAIFCVFSNVKSLTQDGGLWWKGASTLPLQSHAVVQLSHFPQTVGPTPSADSTLNLPYSYTHMKQLQNLHKTTSAHRKSSWADTVLSGTLSYTESLVLAMFSPESFVLLVPSLQSIIFLLSLVMHLSYEESSALYLYMPSREFKSPLPYSESYDCSSLYIVFNMLL